MSAYQCLGTTGYIGYTECRQGGMIDDRLREVRSSIPEGIARVMFTPVEQDTVLHGFMKKSEKMPKTDLALAKKRRNGLIKRAGTSTSGRALTTFWSRKDCPRLSPSST
ncbi:hypothetical protein ARC63_10635 [Stenotrophomonas geniculata ATCC 19374 = JCM 13324]|nr:hypothetical protein ARC63_10635 [Stenotrophomonas geniculata ATCC 19374 = JCM 13324]